MVIIIDNYDSFAYNLAQYLGELEREPMVYRNDEVTIGEIEQLAPTHIVISPGPCTPLEAGISNDVIRCFAGKVPILGVCLGHQCIGHVYGAKVVHAPQPTHGKHSPVFHDGKALYREIACPMQGGRYHSLIVSRDQLPDELEISAWTNEGTIMGIRHRHFPIEGVQFHPESIMTPDGHTILRNFLRLKTAAFPEVR